MRLRVVGTISVAIALVLSLYGGDGAGQFVVQRGAAGQPETTRAESQVPQHGGLVANYNVVNLERPLGKDGRPRRDPTMEPGWTLGGIVVDPEGRPVAGARVTPIVEFQWRGLQTTIRMGFDPSVRTNLDGKWYIYDVPFSTSEAVVEIDHGSFRFASQTMTRKEFGVPDGGEPSKKVVMDPGVTVTGRVSDEQGRPIARALIRTKGDKFVRRTWTGDDGIYRLLGCEPKAGRIILATASGRAADLKEIDTRSTSGPVDFMMKPGGTVRMRVKQQSGEAAVKAQIVLREWRGKVTGYGFHRRNEYTDADGNWVWNEAPVDEFQVEVRTPTGVHLASQKLKPRREEYVVQIPDRPTVSGKVVDAETKAPIKSFRVDPGELRSESYTDWHDGVGLTARDGRYHLVNDYGARPYVIRIKADGYRDAVSREIKSEEGAVTVDFELKRAESIRGKVVTPRNLPAAGAKLALGVAGSQINLKNGDFDDGSTYCRRETADQAGRFQFPAQEKNFQLVITHPSGYAMVDSTPDSGLTRIIHLEPWAKVEGTFKIGASVAPNVPLILNNQSENAHGRNGSQIYADNKVTTGPDGRFVFDRVIPGNGSIGRNLLITVEDGPFDFGSSCAVPVAFPAGNTVDVVIGGTGRQVVGKLQTPEGFVGNVDWQYARLLVSPIGDKNAGAVQSFWVTLDRNGVFRIDDVPVGEYSLTMTSLKVEAVALRGFRFNVPQDAGPQTIGPFDLGTVRTTREILGDFVRPRKR